MSPRKKKLKIATMGAPPEISLSDETWTKIETVYGHMIDAGLRNELCIATQQFLDWVPFEFNAPPVRDALDRAKELKAAALRFGAVLTGGRDKRNPQSALYADLLVASLIDDPRLHYPHKKDALRGIITSLIVACNQAIGKFESGDETGHRDGETWDLWIRRLSEILESHNLPWRARKDTDKSDSVSPFVSLVWEMQNHIPVEYRRHHTQSQAALSKGIAVARKKKRDPSKL